MVTGGLRGLGLCVCRWLLESGRASAVLAVGRRPPAEGSAAAAELERLGALGVQHRVCDVTEWEQVEALPNASLVVHCAGTVDDRLMRDVTLESCEAVMGPKVRGTLLLRRRYGDGCCSSGGGDGGEPAAARLAPRLVVFSSSSAPLGIAGQSTYGAANAFLDELCGGDAVQWGGWRGVGMAADLGISPLPGERFMPVQEGLRALGEALDGRPSEPTMVVDVDWAEYAASLDAGLGHAREDPFLADMLAPGPAAMATAAAAAPAVGEALPRHDMLAGTYAANGSAHTFTLTLGDGSGPWQLLQQHVIRDGAAEGPGEGAGEWAPVMPASGYIAWAFEALRALPHPTAPAAHPELFDLRFSRMLELSRRRVCVLSVRFAAPHEAERRRGGGGGGGAGGGGAQGAIDVSCDGTVHCSMRFRPAGRDISVDPPAGKGEGGGGGGGKGAEAAAQQRLVPAPYRAFAAQGFSYGPHFARLRSLRTSGAAATAHLAPAPPAAQAPAAPALCPGVLDAALQLVSFLEAPTAMGVPTRLASLRLLPPPAQPAGHPTGPPRPVSQAHASLAAGTLGGFDVRLLDERGELVAEASGLELSAALEDSAPLALYREAHGGALEPIGAAPVVTSAADEAYAACADGSGAVWFERRGRPSESELGPDLVEVRLEIAVDLSSRRGQLMTAGAFPIGARVALGPQLPRRAGGQGCHPAGHGG